MPAEEILEAAGMGEEVAPMEETAVPADLSTVSRQLDQIIVWQICQIALLAALLGCLLGVACARAFGRIWR